MKLSICLALAVLAGISMGLATLPSDQIQTAPLPGSIGLSGTVADSAKAIDATNPEFGLRTDWEIPNIGRLVSWRITETQEDDVGVPTALTNFSEQEPLDLNKTSVGGNMSMKNATVLNGTMAWF